MNLIEQQRSIELLSTFGLNDIEARIYTFLLNNLPKTALEISRELNIPRTSIYDNTEKLVEKGILEKIIKSNSTQFKAFPIEVLENVIDKEKDRVESLENSLHKLRDIVTIPTLIYPDTEVKYYQGAEGLKQMIWNSLSANQEILGYSTYGRRDIVGKNFMIRFGEEFKKRDLRDRVIINPKPEILDYISNYVNLVNHHQILDDIRKLEENKLYVAGDTMIYNDIFAVGYWQNHEVVGVEIRNAEFVKSQKSIFEILWERAEPLV